MSSADSLSTSRGEPPGSSTTPPDSSIRRERAAIAAQACETCRTRKSKCDEMRPRCSLCTRLNVECHYREPQPTKKDKTMDYILQMVTRINSNVESMTGTLDRLDRKVPDPGGSTAGPRQQRSPAEHPSNQSPDMTYQEMQHDLPEEDSSMTYSRLQRSYQHLTAPHKILLWPSVCTHLMNLGLEAAMDLQYVLQQGTSWLLRQEIRCHQSPLPPTPPSNIIKAGRKVDGEPRNELAGFAFEQMVKYADYYFNTFNVLYPLLDRDAFMEQTLPTAFKSGFPEGDMTSVVALSVFALGQLAQEGTWGEPVSVEGNFRSGIRGGTRECPPALDLFNEVRRRLGFVSTQCTLEGVQVLLMHAIYYEACSRHIDFWTSETAASTACQVLIKCEPIDWDTPRGGLIRRAFWICNLLESWYHCDLDLPLTGISDHEDRIPLPGQAADAFSSERKYVHLQFLALIALRRLITSIHTDLHESTTSPAETHGDWGGPPIHVVMELSRQLDNWRSLLPPGLQWNDDDRFAYPNLETFGHRRPNEPLFAPQGNAITPVEQIHSLHMLTAQLRTRYYYARFMIYRPFVFKALHFPDSMQPEDMSMAGMCLQSAMMWQIAMAPPRDRKRLVPFLFTWNQHFLGILLILRMTTASPLLRQIAEDHLDSADFHQTIQLLLDWMRDMQQICGIANWSWKILQPLYADVLEPDQRS